MNRKTILECADTSALWFDVLPHVRDVEESGDVSPQSMDL